MHWENCVSQGDVRENMTSSIKVGLPEKVRKPGQFGLEEGLVVATSRVCTCLDLANIWRLMQILKGKPIS